MNKEFEILKEWAVHYIKSRDILAKTIESIEHGRKEWDLVVKTQHIEKYYLIVPKLDGFEGIIEKLDNNNVTVITFNTKENLDKLIEHWSRAAKYPKLCFIFVNPKSELERKWIVFPHTHEKVTEKKNLAKGLKSLFQKVEPWKG